MVPEACARFALPLRTEGRLFAAARHGGALSASAVPEISSAGCGVPRRGIPGTLRFFKKQTESMKTLITPAQTVALAFADGEYLPPESVTEADIAAAEVRSILPVVGEKLYEKLLAGAYPELTGDYLAAPLALFTRLEIQPRLDIRTGPCGSVAPESSTCRPAGDEALRRLRHSLRRQARTLLRRASEYLTAHADDYPEYDCRKDVLKRCSTDGNLVQMR